MKSLILGVSILLLVGCSTSRLINFENGSSILKNDRVEVGTDDVSLLFTSVDTIKLNPGPWTAPIKASFSVSPGNRRVGVKLIFSPEKNFTQKIGAANPFNYILESSIDLKVSPETEYMIKAKRDNRIAEYWIESSTGIVETNIETGILNRVTIVPVLY